MRKLLVSIIAFLLYSCAFIPNDISDSEETTQAGWVVGKKYKAVKPLFLIEDDVNGVLFIARSNADHLPNLRGHQCGSTMVPRSLNEFEAAPQKWSHIIEVLPSGTLVRFDGAYNLGGFSALDSRLITLTVSGTVFGKQIRSVNLHCISVVDIDRELYKRDAKWLME